MTQYIECWFTFREPVIENPDDIKDKPVDPDEIPTIAAQKTTHMVSMRYIKICLSDLKVSYNSVDYPRESPCLAYQHLKQDRHQRIQDYIAPDDDPSAKHIKVDFLSGFRIPNDDLFFTYNQSEPNTVVPLEKINVISRTVGTPNTSVLPNRFRGFMIGFAPSGTENTKFYPYVLMVFNTNSASGKYQIYRSEHLDNEQIQYSHRSTFWGEHQHFKDRLQEVEPLKTKTLAITTAMHRDDFEDDDLIYHDDRPGYITFISAIIDDPNPLPPPPTPTYKPSEITQEIIDRHFPPLTGAGLLTSTERGLKPAVPMGSSAKAESEREKQGQRLLKAMQAQRERDIARFKNTGKLPKWWTDSRLTPEEEKIFDPTVSAEEKLRILSKPKPNSKPKADPKSKGIPQRILDAVNALHNKQQAQAQGKAQARAAEQKAKNDITKEQKLAGLMKPLPPITLPTQSLPTVNSGGHTVVDTELLTNLGFSTTTVTPEQAAQRLQQLSIDTETETQVLPLPVHKKRKQSDEAQVEQTRKQFKVNKDDDSDSGSEEITFVPNYTKGGKISKRHPWKMLQIKKVSGLATEVATPVTASFRDSVVADAKERKKKQKAKIDNSIIIDSDEPVNNVSTSSSTSSSTKPNPFARFMYGSPDDSQQPNLNFKPPNYQQQITAPNPYINNTYITSPPPPLPPVQGPTLAAPRPYVLVKAPYPTPVRALEDGHKKAILKYDEVEYEDPLEMYARKRWYSQPHPSSESPPKKKLYVWKLNDLYVYFAQNGDPVCTHEMLKALWSRHMEIPDARLQIRYFDPEPLPHSTLQPSPPERVVDETASTATDTAVANSTVADNETVTSEATVADNETVTSEAAVTNVTDNNDNETVTSEATVADVATDNTATDNTAVSDNNTTNNTLNFELNDDDIAGLFETIEFDESEPEETSRTRVHLTEEPEQESEQEPEPQPKFGAKALLNHYRHH